MSNGQSVQLIITLRQGEPIQVTGPLQDKLICFGLLELAKEAISKYEPSPIIPATAMPLKLVQ